MAALREYAHHRDVLVDTFAKLAEVPQARQAAFRRERTVVRQAAGVVSVSRGGRLEQSHGTASFEVWKALEGRAAAAW